MSKPSTQHSDSSRTNWEQRLPLLSGPVLPGSEEDVLSKRTDTIINEQLNRYANRPRSTFESFKMQPQSRESRRLNTISHLRFALGCSGAISATQRATRSNESPHNLNMGELIGKVQRCNHSRKSLPTDTEIRPRGMVSEMQSNLSTELHTESNSDRSTLEQLQVSWSRVTEVWA